MINNDDKNWKDSKQMFWFIDYLQNEKKKLYSLKSIKIQIQMNSKTKKQKINALQNSKRQFEILINHYFIVFYFCFQFFYFLKIILKWKLKNNWFKPFCNFCGNFHNVPFRWDYSINFDENCWQKFNYLQFIIMNFHDNWQ